MPHKTWLQGELVKAAQFNPYLQDQVVAQFPDAPTRDAQWSAPPKGACCTLDGVPGVLYMWSGTAWVGVTFGRYGAAAASVQSIPNAAFTNVANFAAQAGSPAGGAQVSGAGITFPAGAPTPGLTAVSLRAEIAGTPAANQYATANIFYNGAYQQAGVVIPLGVRVASTTLVLPLDAANPHAFSVQWWHNLGSAQNCTSTLYAFRLGA